MAGYYSCLSDSPRSSVLTLVRFSAHYLWARLLPGLFAFLALSVYTYLLDPNSFGEYSTILAYVFLLNALFYQWLRASVLRFWTTEQHDSRYHSTVIACFLIALTGSTAAHFTIMATMPQADKVAWTIGLIALWMLAWHELILAGLRAKLMPVKFGLLSTVRAVVSLGVGAGLAGAGFGARGILIGLASGYFTANVLYLTFPRSQRMRFAFTPIDLHLVRAFLKYGLPLTVSFSFSFIVSSADRLMLAIMQGSEEVGLYSAAYDLAKNSLDLIMAAVNAAAFTLAVQALDSGEDGRLQEQMRRQAALLLALSVPAAIGLALIAPTISTVLLGAAFRNAAQLLIPLVSLAVLVAGIRSYYVDLAFQLTGRTSLQALVLGVSALVNLALNFLLIPSLGALGATFAALVSYVIALIISLRLARSVMTVPIPTRDLVPILGASLIMVGSILIPPWELSILGLLSQMAAAATTYGLAIVALDFAGTRRTVIQLIMARTGNK